VININCPSCGAEIIFSSSVALFCVCKFCRSLVFRNEQQIELLGNQAELPEDMSPVQLFSEGEAFGAKFRVLGRVKMQWQAGVWNEWYLSFSGGNVGWLAEAQGQWIISTEKKDVAIPESNDLHIERSFKLDGATFIYADIKEAVSYGFEGELPFLSVKDEKRISVDLLSNKSKRFLSFEYDNSGKRAYLGMYVTLAQLKMKNLRVFDGWTT
jgi:hypothetical protein